jgi:hypothetical protein
MSLKVKKVQISVAKGPAGIFPTIVPMCVTMKPLC